MARHPTNSSGGKDGEEIEVLNPNPEPAEVPLPEVDDAAAAVVVADATSKNPPLPPNAPPAPEKRLYRVLKGGMALMPTGMRTLIKEGKVIDNLNYDVRRLQMQGIRLERLEMTIESPNFVE